MKQTYKARFPVTDLEPHPDNPRRGDVDKIAESIDAHGFFGAVLVQESRNRIIAGEHRWKAAQSKGLATVPVILADVDDDEALRIMLSDNRTADAAGYDDPILLSVLSGLDDLTGTGYTDDDMAALAAVSDIAPHLLEREDVEEFGGDSENSDEYYTPAWLFEAMAIEFDLDVASPPTPIPWIPAKAHFTKEDDALTREWDGRVWMNPPYSQLATWVPRWVEHGHGVALVPLSNARWARQVWGDPNVAIVCVAEPDTGSNVKFIGGQISHPVYLLAIGDDCHEAIGRVGTVRVPA